MGRRPQNGYRWVLPGRQRWPRWLDPSNVVSQTRTQTTSWRRAACCAVTAAPSKRLSKLVLCPRDFCTGSPGAHRNQDQEGGNDEKVVVSRNCFDVRHRGRRCRGTSRRRADAMGLRLRGTAAEPNASADAPCSPAATG